MIDKGLTHHIQKYIVSVLFRQRVARFRELRKQGVDSNLFAYHLKLLIRSGMVIKTDSGYTLGQKGIMYVDRLSEANSGVRMQPKVVSMLVVQNSDGDVLLWKRDKQPYIDTWTLPHGKVHIKDPSLTAAAEREVVEKLGLINIHPKHAGDCYVRVQSSGEVISATMLHIFTFETDDIKESAQLVWARPHKLRNYDLAPAVEKIVARTFFRDPYFFEEFNEEYAIMKA